MPPTPRMSVTKRKRVAVEGEQHRAARELALRLLDAVQAAAVEVDLGLQDAVGPDERHEVGARRRRRARPTNGCRLWPGPELRAHRVEGRPARSRAHHDARADARGVGSALIAGDLAPGGCEGEIPGSTSGRVPRIESPVGAPGDQCRPRAGRRAAAQPRELRRSRRRRSAPSAPPSRDRPHRPPGAATGDEIERAVAVDVGHGELLPGGGHGGGQPRGLPGAPRVRLPALEAARARRIELGLAVGVGVGGHHGVERRRRERRDPRRAARSARPVR